jgi:hypothetical protein
MDLTTNGVVITDAIKFVQINKEKLTMSTKEEDNGMESKEPDFDNEKRATRRGTRKGNWRKSNYKYNLLI